MLMPVALNTEAPEPTGASSSADHQMANAEGAVNMIGETAKPDLQTIPSLKILRKKNRRQKRWMLPEKMSQQSSALVK